MTRAEYATKLKETIRMTRDYQDVIGRIPSYDTLAQAEEHARLHNAQRAASRSICSSDIESKLQEAISLSRWCGRYYQPMSATKAIICTELYRLKCLNSPL